MTLNDAVTRWEEYLKRIESLLDDISEDIHNDNFAVDSEAITLFFLHSQLCSVHSTAKLEMKILKAVLDESQEIKIGGCTDDESKNN